MKIHGFSVSVISCDMAEEPRGEPGQYDWTAMVNGNVEYGTEKDARTARAVAFAALERMMPPETR